MSDIKIGAEPSSTRTTKNSVGKNLVTIIFKLLGFVSLFFVSLLLLMVFMSPYMNGYSTIVGYIQVAILFLVPMVLSIIWYKCTKQHSLISATFCFWSYFCYHLAINTYEENAIWD